MPVIGRSDDHRINALVVQNPAEVNVSGDVFASILKRLEFAVQMRLVHIAQRNDLCARNLQKPWNKLVSSPAHTSNGTGRTEPYHRQPDSVTGFLDRGRPVAADNDSRQSERQPGCH